jgi:Tfp pilus assembly protein PilF
MKTICKRSKRRIRLKKSLAVALWGISLLLISCASKQDETVNQGRIEVARQFLASGDHKRAVSYLQQMVRENSKNAELHNLLGLGYLGLGNSAAAVASFQQSLDLEDEDFDTALNLSYAFILEKKYIESRKVLTKIMKEGTYSYMERVHANFGLSWLEEGNCKAAQREFDKALLLDPTFVTAHFNSGKCWLKSNQPAKAVLSFQKAVDFCPGCVDPLLELARAKHRTGARKEAIESLERLLRTRLDRTSTDRTRQLLNELKR